MHTIKFRGKNFNNQWVYGQIIKVVETGKESHWVDSLSYKGWGPQVHDFERITYLIGEGIDIENYTEIEDIESIGQFNKYTNLYEKVRL